MLNENTRRFLYDRFLWKYKTPCPWGRVINGKEPKVGDKRCEICHYLLWKDPSNKIVGCFHPPIISPDTQLYFEGLK